MKNKDKNMVRRHMLENYMMYDDDLKRAKYGSRKLKTKRDKAFALMIEEVEANDCRRNVGDFQKAKTYVRNGNNLIYNADIYRFLCKLKGKRVVDNYLKRGYDEMSLYEGILAQEYVSALREFERGKPIIKPVKKSTTKLTKRKKSSR